MRYIYMFLIIILGVSEISAQNLVENPSFEELESSSSMDSYWLGTTQDWSMFAHHSFHFHKNIRKNGVVMPVGFSKKAQDRGYGVPFNFLGKQDPHTGNAYVGIWVDASRMQTNDTIPNGITGKLSNSLERGKIYEVALYVSRADDYKAATSSLFFVFSDTVFDHKHYENYTMDKIHVDFANPEENYITDSESWQRIAGTFAAKGGEQYFGLFTLPTLSTIHGTGTVGFYIDDVSVTEVRDTFIIEPDKPLVMTGIVFATGNADLLPASYPELDKLQNYLANNPNVKIEISGHTDNVGSSANNLILSQNRAEAVRNYLTEKKISAERLSAKGYGDTQPAVSNASTAGRAANRRVEVKILK